MEAYDSEQKQKLVILKFLLEDYNDGGRKTVEKFYAERKVSFSGNATPVHSRVAGCDAKME